jgi:hypothetical protein
MIALLIGAGLTAAAPSAQPDAAPAAQATRTPTPTPRAGRITGASVNVRRQPGTTAPIIGSLRRGDRIQITGQRPGWYEIVYPSGSNRRGWVSASLVAISNQATAAPRSGAVPAPVILDYQPPSLSWRWDGENAVVGQDWYFDVLLLRGSNNQPYDTAQAFPSDIVKQNGVWTFAQPKRVLCETQMMMAIAVKKDGKWAGWISPMSNAITVGGSCNGGGSGSGPEPEPTTCEGCG